MVDHVTYVKGLSPSVHRSPPPKGCNGIIGVSDGNDGVVEAGQNLSLPEREAGEHLAAQLLMRAWRLTARERQVARLVIEGLSNEEIAKSLRALALFRDLDYPRGVALTQQARSLLGLDATLQVRHL